MITNFLSPLLAIPAFLAGVAQCRPAQVVPRQNTCPLTSVIPTDTYYNIGDKLVLTWDPNHPTKLPDQNLQIQVQSNLVTLIITGYGMNWLGQTIPIYDWKGGSAVIGTPKLGDRSFTWTVEDVGNATGSAYHYLLYVTYYDLFDPENGDVSEICETNYFRVSAL
ncbi:hypothetical protein HD806DRAFT_513999 [Xylariaceae sp. AK1471]|nr:hypothetical protein HD806DRAFT_513999 [Xylariaceae sp. AK1471]